MTNVNHILCRIIDLKNLLKTQPTLFKLGNLSTREKLELLMHDPSFFSNKITLKGLSFSQRMEVLSHCRHRNIDTKSLGLDFSSDEFKKMTASDRHTLLKSEFDRYISTEVYNRLPGYVQNALYIGHPEWVIANIGQKPQLTQGDLNDLARGKPEFIDRYVADQISTHSTTETFWVCMFKHKPEVYKNLFIENIHTIHNKSELRQIFRNYPSLVKRLTPEIMDRAKLTIKEWVLLIKSLSEKKELKNWSMSPEMIDALRFDLTVEVMNGTSRSTSHLKSALNSILKEDETV